MKNCVILWTVTIALLLISPFAQADPPVGSHSINDIGIGSDWLEPQYVTTTGDGFAVYLTARRELYDHNFNASQWIWDFYGNPLTTWRMVVTQSIPVDTPSTTDMGFAHLMRLHYDYIVLVKNIGNTPMTGDVSYTFTASVPSSGQAIVTRDGNISGPTGNSGHQAVVGNVPEAEEVGSVSSWVTGTDNTSGGSYGSVYSESGTETFTLNPGERDFVNLEIIWIKYCERLNYNLFNQGLNLVTYDASVNVSLSAN